MPEPTDHGIATASAALAKAALFDYTIRPDPAVVAAWAQILDDIDPDEAIAAVDLHYSRSNPRRIMPGDVLSLSRIARQDRIQRGVVRRREIEAPRDPEASHRGYLEARAAAAAALAAAGTEADVPDLSAACPWCGSRRGEMCTTNGERRASNHPSRPTEVAA